MTNETADATQESTNVIKSVETSLVIVNVLNDVGSATLTEIASRSGLTKGTAYKHLFTLNRNGFVRKRDKEYSLSFKFLDIGGHLRYQFIGAPSIKTKVQELADKTNEAALFAIREDDNVVTLFREEGSRRVPTRNRIGYRLPIHQTASGKVILAHLPEEDVYHIINRAGLPKATERTITDEEDLFANLETIRDRGYAFNEGESTKGLTAIAAPLIPEDEVIGACAIAGPRHRLEGDHLTEKLADDLLSVVNELELDIAHSYSGGQ